MTYTRNARSGSAGFWMRMAAWMRRLEKGCAALALAMAASAVLAASAAADPSPTGRTPKLFWTPERQAVWNRMRAENHPWWQQIKANADLSGTSTARYADLGQWATMAYQVTGDPVYAQKAFAEADNNLKGAAAPDSSRNFTREHFIEYAWMYDWLYPALTSAQRSQWVSSLNFWADLCLGDTSITWGTRLSDSDETTGHYFGIVLWDLASAGSNSRAGSFIADGQTGGLDKSSNSRNNMRNAVADYVRRAEGGEWIESSKYNMGTLQLLLMGAEGVKTATGVNHFPEVTALQKDIALAQMHEVTPDLKRAFQWGDNEEPRSLNRDRRASLLAMVAGLLQSDSSIGPAVNNFMSTIKGSEPPNFRWMILGNPYAASTDFRNVLKPGHVASGMGLLYARDSSQSGGSLFASHMSSRSTVDHETHYMANFDLYRNGEFAVTHVIGYDANEAEHHNSMLLGGLSVMDEARGPLAAEIGADGSYAYHVGSTGGNRYKQGYFNPPPRFVHEWTRSLLYVPSADKSSDTVVMFDRVNAEAPSSISLYRAEDQTRINGAPALKQLILHTAVSPSLSSDAITWQTAGGQTVRVSTLLPTGQSRVIKSDASSGLKGTIVDSEKKYQVRIMPPTARRWDTFLNVVYAYNGGTAPTATLITGGAAQGALIKRPGQPNVVALFNGAQGPDLPPSKVVSGALEANTGLLKTLGANRLFSNGFQVTWSSDTSSTKVFLGDLDPAKQWLITVDSQTEAPLPVSDQGLGRITVSGSGSHTIIVRSSGGVIDPPPIDPTDTTNPVISNIQVTDITTAGAVVTWTTDEPATGRADYGPTTSYGLTAAADLLGTSHSATLIGLQAGTVYHFQVQATDGAGNTALSADGTLTTAAAPTASFTEVSGEVRIEAERFDARIPRGGQDWVLETSHPGYEGSGYLRALPNLGMNINTGYVTTSPELVYNVQFSTPGTYYVWVRGQADTTSDDSVHVGIDGAGPSTCDRIGDVPADWSWLQSTMDGAVATLVVPTPGLHTIHVWMRQDGFGLDQLLLRTDSSSTPPGGDVPPPPAPTVNQPPVLDPIGDQTVTAGQALTISTSGTDPDGDALTFSAAPLPAGATMNSPFTWTPTSSQVGTYTVTFSASDGELTDSETITITVAASNQPPTVNAGTDQTIVLPDSANLAGQVTDDGLPTGKSLTSVWTMVSGPGSVNFGITPVGPTTTASFTVAGTYVIRLTANDGALTASDDVTVTVQAAPQTAAPLISNVSAVTGARLVVDRLGVGKLVFIDRDFVFTDIPSKLVGAEYIRMANEDKYRKDTAYVTFTLKAKATVYVLFSTSTSNVPSWLSAWTPITGRVYTSDSPRRMFKRSFPAGTVSLSGNGALWKIDPFSQYSVVVIPE